MVDCYGSPGKSITQPSRHSRDGEKNITTFLLLLLLRRNITLQSDVHRDGKNLQTCFQFTRELFRAVTHIHHHHHHPQIILCRIIPPHFYNKVSKHLPYRRLSCITNVFLSLLKCGAQASLVSWWIRSRLPMTQVWFLVQEGSTCQGAAGPRSCNYWTHVLQLPAPREPLCNKGSHHNETAQLEKSGAKQQRPLATNNQSR